jgi:hypothetical protein
MSITTLTYEPGEEGPHKHSHTTRDYGAWEIGPGDLKIFPELSPGTCITIPEGRKASIIIISAFTNSRNTLLTTDPSYSYHNHGKSSNNTGFICLTS